MPKLISDAAIDLVLGISPTFWYSRWYTESEIGKCCRGTFQFLSPNELSDTDHSTNALFRIWSMMSSLWQNGTDDGCQYNYITITDL